VYSRLIHVSTHWGATDSELVRELPGDELLPETNSTTYAITIELPPDDVWPWLVQIGRGRGGFYTYTSIERFLGADIANLDRIDPQPADARARRPDLDDSGALSWPAPRSVLVGTPGGARGLLDRHRSESVRERSVHRRMRSGSLAHC
jgi:hypothetical protein